MVPSLTSSPSASDSVRTSSNPYRLPSRSSARTQYSRVPFRSWLTALRARPGSMHHKVLCDPWRSKTFRRGRNTRTSARQEQRRLAGNGRERSEGGRQACVLGMATRLRTTAPCASASERGLGSCRFGEDRVQVVFGEDDGIALCAAGLHRAGGDVAEVAGSQAEFAQPG